MNNLGQVTRRRRPALAATEEAVAIYRRVTDANPAAHEAGLAQALTNLGQMLPGRRQRQRALAVTAEAVKIYRRLAEITANDRDVDLARSLAAFAQVRMTASIELPAALAAMTEATAIYKRLAAQRPTAFGDDPSPAYQATADVLDRLHRKDDARALRQLAVDRSDG